MKFQATLLLSGKTATGIQVPPEIVTALGSGKRPAVRVTLKGHTYRTTIAPMNDVFMLPVSGEHREAAGLTAGDQFEVEIELDTEPRELAIPPDFTAALDAAPDAKRFFDSLSYSNKSRFTLSVEGAKTAETRQRRIEKAIATLREGKT